MMHISRRAAAVGAAVFTGLASLGAAGAAFASPAAPPTHKTVQVLRLHTVFASLAAGQAARPAGSALVKELYGSSSQVQGWSVMVKVQDDSAGGAGWYWFERFGGTTFTSGFGVPVCTGCHSAGNDFVRSPFPLQ